MGWCNSRGIPASVYAIAVAGGWHLAPSKLLRKSCVRFLHLMIIWMLCTPTVGLLMID